MKTRNARLFLELFLARCLSLGQTRCFQVRQGQLIQLGYVSLKIGGKIEIQKLPCISCLYLPYKQTITIYDIED